MFFYFLIIQLATCAAIDRHNLDGSDRNLPALWTVEGSHI